MTSWFVIPLEENEAEKTADEDDSGNSHDGDDDEGVITEIRFVPSDKAACEWLHVDWGSKFFTTLYLINMNAFTLNKVIFQYNIFAFNPVLSLDATTVY